MAMIKKFVALLFLFLTACGDDSRVRSLIEAAGFGDVHRMTLLIDGGADVNGVALDGWTPLTQAAHAGQLEAVKLLVARGANIDYGAVTPLYWAAFQGRLEVAKFLLHNGAHLKLDPIAKASFVDRVRSYGNKELERLVIETMTRENG